MQSPPQTASVSEYAPDEAERALPNDDRVYQIVTVAAILLILASLWIF